jgi:hypothetical protein
MLYSEVKQLLRVHAAATPATRTRTQRHRYEVVHTLREDGEVSLKLQLAAEYERKRSHTQLSWSSFLYCPRLVTHPNDAEFLTSIATMPKHVQVDVVALRNRLNGNVPTTHHAPWSILAEHYPPVVEVDRWSDEEFFEWLFAVLSFAHGVACDRPPVDTAERLLKWARSARHGERPLDRTFRLRLSSAWKVQAR